MANTLLDASAERGARLLIQRFLDEAGAGIERLADPDDEEALHDFRVGLRRLRSTERAYRPFLDAAIGKKLRKRIGTLAGSTGTARDSEVQLAWLETRREGLRSHERAGYLWLHRRLRERMRSEYAAVRAYAPGEFARIRERLQERLALRCEEGPRRLGEVAAAGLREAAAELAAHLERVHGEADEDEVHQARIAGKRLRYLLEPLRDEIEGGRAAIKTLKQLQDLLGEIHDVQVMAAELGQAAEEAGAARLRRLIELSMTRAADDPEFEQTRRRDERAGLMRLARELHERRQDLFARLMGRLESGALAAVIDGLHMAAGALEAAAHTAGAGPTD